jgi:hypothetical protein
MMFIGGAACLLAIWLPWIQLKVGSSLNGLSGYGVYAVPLLVPMIVLALAGDLRVPWRGRTLALALIPCLAAAMLGILQISMVYGFAGEGVVRRGPEKLLEGANVGMGLWLFVVGGLAVPVAAFALSQARPIDPASPENTKSLSG